MRPAYGLVLLALAGCSSSPDRSDGAVTDVALATDVGADIGADVGSDVGLDAGSDVGVAIDLGGATPCTAGRIESCPCAGGGAGAQTCGADGVYGPCVCLVVDAGALDVPALDAPINDVGGGDSAAADAGTGPVDAPGIAGDDYCRASAVGTVCTGAAVDTCGVCVTPAVTGVIARTHCDDTHRREYCRAGVVGAPELGCFQAGSYPVAGASQSVTMWGSVRALGNGGDTQHIRVSVYRVAADGTPGELVGVAVSDVAASTAGTEDVYTPSGVVDFSRRTGGYQIAGVPTETELLVVTQGDPADAESAGLWSHRVYTYDVALLNADVGVVVAPAGIAGTRTVRYLPLVVANADWTALPAVSTLTAGIAAGRAMIVGEVHDCADVRLANATVESSPRRAWDGPVVYFSENDTHPLPDLSRGDRGTSLLGGYMLLDVDPGIVHLAALGRDASGTLVHLGSRRVRAFADSVTWVTLRGLRPWQVMTGGADAGAR